MKSITFKKFIARLFLAAMLGSLMLPLSALAQIEPGSPEDLNAVFGSGAAETCSGLLGTLGLISCDVVPTEVPLNVKRDIANKIAGDIAKMLVHKLTDQIVNLIRAGGQGGPLFVQDWNQFLLDAADQASGVFIKELGLTQLCEPFAPRLRLIFAGGRVAMRERLRCTVTAVARNLQSFFEDFNNGGWQRWIEITQVQNNPFGIYLSLLEDKEIKEVKAVQSALNEALAAQGFLNQKECVKQEDPDDPEKGTTDVCFTVSPGKYLENRLAELTTSDIRQLELADSFNEIILAAFQSLVQNLFFSAGGLASSDIRSTTITSQLQNDLDNLKQSAISFSGVDSAIAVTGSIITKKNDSLAKIKDEIITLGKLKTCQISKNLPTNATENSINAATSTKLALENNILDQTLFNETLKDDKAALLGATTVEELNQALAKAQNDVTKIGSLGAATLENAKITADKKKAEDDLAACLNPPVVNP